MDKRTELLGLYPSGVGMINSLLQSSENINKNDKYLKSKKN